MTDRKILAELRRQLSLSRADRDAALTELAVARSELMAHGVLRERSSTALPRGSRGL